MYILLMLQKRHRGPPCRSSRDPIPPTAAMDDLSITIFKKHGHVRFSCNTTAISLEEAR